MSQEVYLHKTGHTPHFVVWIGLAGIALCIGRKRPPLSPDSIFGNILFVGCLPYLSKLTLRCCSAIRQGEKQFHLKHLKIGIYNNSLNFISANLLISSL